MREMEERLAKMNQGIKVKSALGFGLCASMQMLASS
jgi:hypothetical protein